MQRLLPLLISLCSLLLVSNVAFGSGGEVHKLPWGDFAFRIVTFCAVIGIVAYFFGKKIIGFFKGRTEAIANDISSLEMQKASTQQHLAEVEKRIARLETERQAILAEYKAQGEALKASIIAEAEKNAASIAHQAKLTAQSEITSAIDTMRVEMAEKIVEAMEKQLAKKLSADEHVKLIDKYLTKVVLN